MKRFMRFALMFLGVSMFFNCHPTLWQPLQTPPKSETKFLGSKVFHGLPDAVCTASYACTSIGCPKNMNEINQTMQSYFKWFQILPHKSMLLAQQNGYLLRFKWDSKKLIEKYGKAKLPYTKGQAWLISLVTQAPNFSSIKDGGSHLNDYMTNLPCAYKSLNYAQFFNKPEFETMLGQECNIPLELSSKLQLYSSKKYIEEKTYHTNAFSVGSMCPENLKADTWYFILLKLKPGKQKTTMARIESQLLEDTFHIQPNQVLSNKPKPELSDCPYLISSSHIQDGARTALCGKYAKNVWLNRICIPTKEYVFIPGVDTKNSSSRPAYCYDDTQPPYENGDGDGWFDTRTHVTDIAGNSLPITNNMLMHGSHIGDCFNMDASNFMHTDKCNWYNIGHIASGKQCYWDHYHNKCFFDKSKNILHYPEEFLKTYFAQSSRFNSYAGSLDHIGRATSWVKHVKNGFVQFVNYGSQGKGGLTLHLSKGSKNVIYSSYPFWEFYMYRLNGMYGALGFPISKAQKKEFYFEQHFEFGWIRKYHDTKNCYLVKLPNQTPEKYCFSCKSSKDCGHKNSICTNRRCLNKNQISYTNQKKCINSFLCKTNEVCVQNLCTKK